MLADPFDSHRKMLVSAIARASKQRQFTHTQELAQLGKRLEEIAGDFDELATKIEHALAGVASKAVLKIDDLPTAEVLSAKAYGKKIRDSWANEHSCKVVHGTLYQAANNQTVGIAFNRESVQDPGKFFWGLRDSDKPQIVVLLGELVDKTIFDLVLDPAFVAAIWPKLSPNKNDRKFNVRRSEAGVYEMLIPKEGWIDVSNSLGQKNTLSL